MCQRSLSTIKTIKTNAFIWNYTEKEGLALQSYN